MNIEDFDEFKKKLTKLLEQNVLYNSPLSINNLINFEDLLDIMLVLLKNEKGNYFLNQTERKVLLKLLTARYTGESFSEHNKRKLKTHFAKDLFDRILQRQKDNSNNDVSVREFFFNTLK
ncbi:MAG: hypothetical protein IKB70_10340 [Bacilli bacterium]|nr:hypothetical protein [Bacilli bacterium]